METKANVIKLELTNQEFLNMSENGGYNLNNFSDKINAFAPLVHLLYIGIHTGTRTKDSYQTGMLEYITPLLEQMLEQTIIPDDTQLISIDTKQNDYTGFHIWTFAINDLDALDEDETMLITLKECFQDIFPYDPQACFGHAPQITYCNGLFYIIDPFTC